MSGKVFIIKKDKEIKGVFSNLSKTNRAFQEMLEDKKSKRIAPATKVKPFQPTLFPTYRKIHLILKESEVYRFKKFTIEKHKIQ